MSIALILSVSIMGDTRESLDAKDKPFIITDGVVNVLPKLETKMHILRNAVDFANKLGISKDKVLVTVDKYANTSSASIPLTLDHALSKKIVKRGDIIVFEAIGGGLTWGCSILKY